MATDDVKVYGVGMVYASACVPKEMARKDIEHAVNNQHPTGIDSRWTIAEESFQSGDPNPCVCHDSSHRLHYLLTC